LKIFAGRSSVMVTGSGPQENVMTPPFATAAMNASAVQLAAVPLPTTVVGADESSAAASAGTSQCPSGFPAGGPSFGFVFGFPPLPPPVVALGLLEELLVSFDVLPQPHPRAASATKKRGSIRRIVVLHLRS
jgi:hypothetical protein